MSGYYDYDLGIQKEAGFTVIGVDEAGRGPLAGPVAAAAVRLDLEYPIEGIKDSKKISPRRRADIYQKIKAGAAEWNCAFAEPGEIDEINILRASLLAMKRAVEPLLTGKTMVLVDGNTLIDGLPADIQRTVIGGDSLSASIAAASIIAKVTRDTLMEKYHRDYPVYGFDKHKGYPTKLHREMVIKHGICDIHRISFCAKFINSA